MADRQDVVAGRYRLTRPVGSGGMGTVWMARDEMLDRDVAVKEFIPPPWMSDDDRDKLRLRTLREARTASRLNHPNVVQIYDVVHAGGLPWIVMEYVPSRSLHQVVREDGPLTPAGAARMGLSVLQALDAAHRAGVLHRDVKPHNVLIGDHGRVVLTDFGLARFVDDGGVTGPGPIVGSPQYVSPERARAGTSTVESDLWSLGATLYAAVEGRSPYARETSTATLLALATEPPDPPARAGVLQPVLAGLLRHDPAERLSAGEVGDVLRKVLATAEPYALSSPRRPVADGADPLVPRQRRGVTATARAQVPVPREAPPQPVPELPAEQTRAEKAPADDPAAEQPPIEARQHPDTPDGPSWPTGPRRTPAPPMSRRRVLLIGTFVAAVVLAAGGTGVLASRWFDHSDVAASLPRPSTTAPSSPSVEPAPNTGGRAAGVGTFSPTACELAAVDGLPRTPREGAKRIADNGYAMPPSWSYHVADGFGIAVPDGWTYQRVGSTFCFRDPDGFRVLSVDPDRKADSDPVTACRGEAKKLTEANLLPDYREIGIGAVTYFGKAAEWEYRYRGGAGTGVHANTRWFAAGGRAYAVGWVTREFDWTANRVYLNMIMSSFSPT